jgi:fructose-bisphosphate aldolase class I
MTTQYDTQLERVGTADGFIAALDQSGGSTPKARAAKGVAAHPWSTDGEMFDLVHAMRTRIMTSSGFTGDRVVGAILFEQTMDRQVDGLTTPDYLWNRKQVVPFVKTDVGLADEADGVQLMKDNPGLGSLLELASAKGVFGTKMRSVVQSANRTGVEQLVAQQFAVGNQIIDAGLMPIIEPEVNIEAADKQEAEELVLQAITKELDALNDRKVMLKLTLPETPDHYASLVAHPNVVRVVALSGGYDLEESCSRLAQNAGTIASFSRVLTNGLYADQPQPEFDAAITATIEKIFEASIT